MPRPNERESDNIRKAEKRAGERSIVIPRPQDLARRESLELDTSAWLRHYMAGAFTDPFTADQEEIIADVETVMRDGGRQAEAAPRGDGKTTIVKGVIIKAVCTGQLDFLVGIGSTGRQTEEAILEGVKYEFESNDALLADYPEICAPIRALEGSAKRSAMQTHVDADGNHRRTDFQWAGDGVVFPTVANLDWMNASNARQIGDLWGSRASDTCFRTRGLDAAILGLIYHNRRPKFVLVDDPDTEESATSPVQTEKRCKTLRRSISHLGGKRKMGVVMLTTVRALDSVSDIFTDPKREPSYNGKRYKALKVWPEREDLWERYVELRRTYDPMVEGAKDQAQAAATEFYRENRVAMDTGAEVSNPYRFDSARGQLSALQRCFDIIADDGREAFETECQNEPPVEEAVEEAGLTDVAVRSRVTARPRGESPPDILRNLRWGDGLSIGIDVGKFACHFVAIAWRSQAFGEVIDYGRINVYEPNETGIEKAILKALLDFRDELAADPYVTPDGEVLRPSFVLVDAQYQTDTVRKFCEASGAPFFPSHGYGHGHAGMKAFRVPTAGVIAGDHLYMKAQEFHIDADHWKSWVHSRFLVEVGKPASLMLFGDDPREHKIYSEHIVAEKWDGIKGAWKKVSKANHMLDATTLASAGGSVLGVRATPAPVSINTARTQRPKARVTGGWKR